jgi:archaellum component FlaF (FlaF/FlaG flagellin family)
MATIKMFVGIFVIVGGLYVAYKVVPPYMSNYQFQDAVKDEATRDSYTPKSDAEIKAAVLKKAQELDVPLTEDGITVEKQGSQFNGTVIIRCPYVVHVDLPGYPFDLHFDASTTNKGVF